MMPEINAVRLICWAGLHLRQSHFADVLKGCAAIDATGQDVPMVYSLRTVAYNGLGQFDNALQSARKWEDALGGDRELYFQMGTALKGLKHNEAAAGAFAKSLDEDPDAAGSLAHLSMSLPTGKKNEIARRFALCQNPAAVFVQSVPILQCARDLEGMQTLIDAYRASPQSTQDPWLLYYDSELKIIHKQYKEAETQLKTLLPYASKKGQESFRHEYLYASALAGDALEGYAAATDSVDAFQRLASRLLNVDDKTLGQLITLHLQHFPKDPQAHYYSAGA